MAEQLELMAAELKSEDPDHTPPRATPPQPMKATGGHMRFVQGIQQSPRIPDVENADADTEDGLEDLFSMMCAEESPPPTVARKLEAVRGDESRGTGSSRGDAEVPPPLRIAVHSVRPVPVAPDEMSPPPVEKNSSLPLKKQDPSRPATLAEGMEKELARVGPALLRLNAKLCAGDVGGREYFLELIELYRDNAECHRWADCVSDLPRDATPELRVKASAVLKHVAPCRDAVMAARFLAANEMSVEGATVALRAHLKWQRDVMDPLLNDPAPIMGQLLGGGHVPCGVDRSGNPIVLTCTHQWHARARVKGEDGVSAADNFKRAACFVYVRKGVESVGRGGDGRGRESGGGGEDYE